MEKLEKAWVPELGAVLPASPGGHCRAVTDREIQVCVPKSPSLGLLVSAAEQGRVDCSPAGAGPADAQWVSGRPESLSAVPRALGRCRHTHLIQDGGGLGPEGQPWRGGSRRVLLGIRVLQQPAFARFLHQRPVGQHTCLRSPVPLVAPPDSSERGRERHPNSFQSSLCTDSGVVKCWPMAPAPSAGTPAGYLEPGAPRPTVPLMAIMMRTTANQRLALRRCSINAESSHRCAAWAPTTCLTPFQALGTQKPNQARIQILEEGGRR